MKLESAKIRKISDNQKVIHKFLSPFGLKDKYFFGRECKIAKQLIDKYGLDYILWVPLPFGGDKLESLRFFLVKDGENYLISFQLEYKKQTTDLSAQPKQIELLEEKIGEDTIIKREPKTLLDFLNKYN